MKPMREPHPFDEMVRRPDREIRLAHAALLWARDEHSDMTPAHYLDRLNALADRVEAKDAQCGHERIEALRHVLVEAEAFRGNYEGFTRPENSYLNRVIDTRRGIPVSLSVIWLDLAEQLDWPLVGLTLPGHFIIRYDGVGDELLVDPFNEGREITREQCSTMLSGLFGREFELTDEHMTPASERAILARMLGNLYAAYASKEDWLRTGRVLRRITALRPKDAMVHAELGRVLMLVGDLKSAATVLNKAEELARGEEESATVIHHLNELRFRLHQRN